MADIVGTGGLLYKRDIFWPVVDTILICSGLLTTSNLGLVVN